MPSLLAPSITVLPLGSTTGLPSISMFSMAGGSCVRRDEALLVVDVMLEFAAEVLDEALHRQCGGVAQRADRASGDVVGHRHQQVEVLLAAFAVLDAVDDTP